MMKMNEFMTALQTHLANQQPNYPDDNADTVLGMLCSTYYERNCNQDTDEVKQAYGELYQSMTGKSRKEKDEVIYAACRLCSRHQQTGFIDGIRLGLHMAQELNK